MTWDGTLGERSLRPPPLCHAGAPTAGAPASPVAGADCVSAGAGEADGGAVGTRGPNDSPGGGAEAVAVAAGGTDGEAGGTDGKEPLALWPGGEDEDCETAGAAAAGGIADEAAAVDSTASAAGPEPIMIVLAKEEFLFADGFADGACEFGRGGTDGLVDGERGAAGGGALAVARRTS